jgi:hypothetical protein
MINFALAGKRPLTVIRKSLINQNLNLEKWYFIRIVEIVAPAKDISRLAGNWNTSSPNPS